MVSSSGQLLEEISINPKCNFAKRGYPVPILEDVYFWKGRIHCKGYSRDALPHFQYTKPSSKNLTGEIPSDLAELIQNGHVTRVEGVSTVFRLPDSKGVNMEHYLIDNMFGLAAVLLRSEQIGIPSVDNIIIIGEGFPEQEMYPI